MIKLDMDLRRFCLKYDLPFNSSDRCYKCGIEVKLEHPVITKDRVGLESSPHEPCGEPYKISLLSPRGKNPFENL